MLFHSAEIRWFFRGKPHEEFNSWFEADGLHRDEGARVDDYLVLPRCATTGIKIRDGRFEVKAATGRPAMVEMPNGMRGFKGTWVKWSRKAGDAAAVRSLITGADETVLSIEKRRSLRLISLEGDAPVEIRPGERQLVQGCQVESTILRAAPLGRDLAAAAHWWSLSLEAFGEIDDIVVNLDEVTGYLFRDDIGIAADERDSMSYPAWLDRLR